jgi:putative sigma-54 modulation protein
MPTLLERKKQSEHDHLGYRRSVLLQFNREENMEILIRNAEGNLSEKDREYASTKFNKLSHFFAKATKVEIVHREEKLQHKAVHRIEVTVNADGFIVRGEDADASIHAAIDKVADRLETRMKKVKEKLIQNHRRKGSDIPEKLEAMAPVPDHEYFEIKERKQFLVKPMSYEEAALHLEMIDHPFYIFKSEDTGRTECLYRRKDGHYGLLQPEG